MAPPAPPSRQLIAVLIIAMLVTGCSNSELSFSELTSLELALTLARARLVVQVAGQCIVGHVRRVNAG